MEALGKNKPLYLYCRSGGRSGQALGMLKAAGFTDAEMTPYNAEVMDIPLATLRTLPDVP